MALAALGRGRAERRRGQGRLKKGSGKMVQSSPRQKRSWLPVGRYLMTNQASSGPLISLPVYPLLLDVLDEGFPAPISLMLLSTEFFQGMEAVSTPSRSKPEMSTKLSLMKSFSFLIIEPTKGKKRFALIAGTWNTQPGVKHPFILHDCDRRSRPS